MKHKSRDLFSLMDDQVEDSQHSQLVVVTDYTHSGRECGCCALLLYKYN